MFLFCCPASIFNIFPVKVVAIPSSVAQGIFLQLIQHLRSACVWMRTSHHRHLLPCVIASIRQYLEAYLLEHERTGFEPRTSGYKTNCSTIEPSQLLIITFYFLITSFYFLNLFLETSFITHVF